MALDVLLQNVSPLISSYESLTEMPIGNSSSGFSNGMGNVKTDV